jgi:hypothetical protein
MKRVIATTCTVLMCLAVHRPLQACSMGLSYRGLPRPGAILVLGVVVGHMQTARPIDGIAVAPSLLVRPTVVVSGSIAQETVEVVPLSYGTDCRTTVPMRPTDLERLYPIGALVGISPAWRTSPESRSTGMIVVETNQGGFVAVMPQDVKRTPNGDLDFDFFEKQNGYSPYSWTLGEFEFARAIVALRQALPGERVNRLLNLIHYEAFRIGDGRNWLDQLMAEISIGGQDRNVVLSALRTLTRKAP